jgi:hypothetical protein
MLCVLPAINRYLHYEPQRDADVSFSITKIFPLRLVGLYVCTTHTYALIKCGTDGKMNMTYLGLNMIPFFLARTAMK